MLYARGGLIRALDGFVLSMTKVFISSCDIETPHATALIQWLGEGNFEVIHSPLDLGGNLWGDVRYGGSCVNH
jgi:hypothetical protein